MAKNISTSEFKTAIKDLNGLLTSSDAKPIKFVGVKKEQVLKDFTKSVLDFIENDKASKLPDSVIDFYNTYIAKDDAEDDAKDDAKNKKKPAKSKDKAKPKTKKVGHEIIKAIVENGNCVDREKVLNVVAKVFPDRKKDGMKTTVNHVIGVMNNYFNYINSKK